MTRYQVLDNNKPAQYPYCNVSPSWNKSIYDSWEEAHEYAQKWLGDFAGCELKPNEPYNYSGAGDTIEIKIRIYK